MIYYLYKEKMRMFSVHSLGCIIHKMIRLMCLYIYIIINVLTFFNDNINLFLISYFKADNFFKIFLYLKIDWLISHNL